MLRLTKFKTYKMRENEFIKNSLKKQMQNKSIIYLLFICLILIKPVLSFSQWTNNSSINTSVCTANNDQKDYSIASDTKGGAFIIWADKRNNLQRADIFAQRINSLGFNLWAVDGIGVCVTSADKANPTTTEDGNGGVIIAWDDSINADRDIYAQKLDSSGNQKWTTNGVPIVIKASKQKNVKIVSDGAGGAIAVWEDSLSGYWDIYAQRINSDGLTMWTIGGVPVCTAILNQKSPRLVSDGSGGAYITWQDKRGGVDYDIYAQHLNSSGVPQFALNGIVICNAIDKQTDPKIVSDRFGGAIVTWQDKRGGISYDVYAQRITATGSLQWILNGVAVCTADSSQTSIDITSDNISGAILTWRDKRNGLYHDIYAQKVNMTGTIAWQLNGIKISSTALTQTNPNICGDGSGGAIITWQDSTIGNWDILTQRVNSSGNIMWSSGGNFVSNANNIQINPKNISDGKGGCIYIWQDFRNGLNDDVYAQHLTALGVEGIGDEIILEPVLFNIFPNPISESAIIDCSDKKNNLDLCIGIVYDIFGREICLFNIDKFDYKLDVKNFSDGVYLLKIYEKEKVIACKKFIVKK